MTILTKEETNKCLADIDIALSQMDALVYENEALKAELTHAQTYKDDAERYRCLAEHVDFGDWFCGYCVIKDSYGGTEDFYMDDKKHMDETIDKAITKGEIK